jgi:fluoroacetyl-CoA thioesterase
MDLPAGLTGRAVLTVTPADTAEAVGSGDVPVLATPRLLALAEAATVDALRDRLPAGLTTVGVRVELSHQAATPVGARVSAEAQLVTVDGRSLRFTVKVTDDAGAAARVVAEGTIDRAAVDRARFLARLPA